MSSRRPPAKTPAKISGKTVGKTPARTAAKSAARLSRPPPSPDDRPTAPKVVARDSAANTRIFTFLVVTFLARADRLRRQHYDEDIDLAVIAEAIGVAAIEPRMREKTFRQGFRSLDKVAGVARQRPVNALSIATTTGIARETTRRKIKKLLAMGVLIETGRGRYVLTPGYLQTSPQRRLFRTLAHETANFFNACLEEGLFEMPAGRPGRKSHVPEQAPSPPSEEA